MMPEATGHEGLSRAWIRESYIDLNMRLGCAIACTVPLCVQSADSCVCRTPLGGQHGSLGLLMTSQGVHMLSTPCVIPTPVTRARPGMPRRAWDGQFPRLVALVGSFDLTSSQP